jgi:hypothetical protein
LASLFIFPTLAAKHHIDEPPNACWRIFEAQERITPASAFFKLKKFCTLFSGVMLQFGQPFCSEQYSLPKSKFMFTLLLMPNLLYLSAIDPF